jgi:hypothetical protein
VSGIPGPRLRMPYFAILGFARVSKFVARVTGAHASI